MKSKITVRPFDSERKNLIRGNTVADGKNLQQKIVYSASRSPKFACIVVTFTDGTEKRFTPEDVALMKSSGSHPVKGNKLVSIKKRPSARVTEDDSDGEEVCHHKGCEGHGMTHCNHLASLRRHRTAGIKVGVIDEIVHFAKKKGGTVVDFGKYLKEKFPSRPVKAMMNTVKCQLGRGDLKAKGHKIVKERIGRTVKYRIVG